MYLFNSQNCDLTSLKRNKHYITLQELCVSFMVEFMFSKNYNAEYRKLTNTSLKFKVPHRKREWF